MQYITKAETAPPLPPIGPHIEITAMEDTYALLVAISSVPIQHVFVIHWLDDPRPSIRDALRVGLPNLTIDGPVLLRLLHPALPRVADVEVTI